MKPETVFHIYSELDVNGKKRFLRMIGIERKPKQNKDYRPYLMRFFK